MPIKHYVKAEFRARYDPYYDFSLFIVVTVIPIVEGNDGVSDDARVYAGYANTSARSPREAKRVVKALAKALSEACDLYEEKIVGLLYHGGLIPLLGDPTELFHALEELGYYVRHAEMTYAQFASASLASIGSQGE